MIDLHAISMEIHSPYCGDSFTIQLINIKLERIVICHNCKADICLKDTDSSISRGMEDINRELIALENIIKKIGK